MCQWMSGWATRDGDLLTHPATDAHVDLAESFGINDIMPADDPRRTATPIEYSSGGRLDDLSSYRLRYDARRPAWATDEWEARIIAKCRARIEACIVRDARIILLGGAWILAGKASVKRAASARILAMYDSSRVGVLLDSSRVGELYDSSHVGVLCDSSCVEHDRRGAMKERP